jgi:hypothetical protein
MKMRRFIELVIRVRRLVARTPGGEAVIKGRAQRTTKRRLGGRLTEFSFRLAFMIDLAYVGIGALGGTAVGRALPAAPPPSDRSAMVCSAYPTPGR